MMKLNEIDLYVTEKCNLHCPFCSIEANNRQPSAMSLDKIYEIITEAKKLGLEELHLTGGEPSLRTDLEEIIRYAAHLGLNIRLITNGSILNSGKLQRLYDAGLRSLMISIDGYEEYHDRVRGKGVYAKAMKLIQSALLLEGFTLRVNSVAWKDNEHELLKLARDFNHMGIHIYSIFLGSPLGFGADAKANVFEAREWQRFTNQLQEIVNKDKFQMKVVIEKGFIFGDELLPDEPLEGRGVGCFNLGNHYDYFLIRGNGDVYPCVFYSNDAPPIGNVHQEPLQDLLQRFSLDPFYEEVGQVPGECASCSFIASCKGGCRGYAQIYKGEWVYADSRCQPKGNKEYIPVCPIMKKNLNTGLIGGSSEQALKIQECKG